MTISCYSIVKRWHKSQKLNRIGRRNESRGLEWNTSSHVIVVQGKEVQDEDSTTIVDGMLYLFYAYSLLLCYRPSRKYFISRLSAFYCCWCVNLCGIYEMDSSYGKSRESYDVRSSRSRTIASDRGMSETSSSNIPAACLHYSPSRSVYQSNWKGELLLSCRSGERQTVADIFVESKLSGLASPKRLKSCLKTRKFLLMKTEVACLMSCIPVYVKAFCHFRFIPRKDQYQALSHCHTSIAEDQRWVPLLRFVTSLHEKVTMDLFITSSDDSPCNYTSTFLLNVAYNYNWPTHASRWMKMCLHNQIGFHQKLA